MRSEISSTEAVRNFSELLNNIKYRGDHYTVIRAGKPAAAIVPVEPTCRGCTLGSLKEIFRQLPHLDPDDETFMSDILSSKAAQPLMPTAAKWE